MWTIPNKYLYYFFVWLQIDNNDEGDERDPGVPDDIWEELKISKLREAEKEEKWKKEEESIQK